MNMQAEARDIIEMISRYGASNRHKCCFIGSFIAFDEEKNQVKEGSDIVFAFGHKKLLVSMINDLRDTIEEDADEDGIVNI